VSSIASISSFDDLFGTNPFVLGDNVPVADGLENDADYVDSQLSHMDMRNEVCSPSEEWEQEPVYEELCDLKVASDYSGSAVPSACVEKKRKSKKIKLKEEKLDLQCGWRYCDYCTSNLDHFVRHVSFHLPHLEVKLNKDQEGTGSVVFPTILPASSSTWQSHLCSHMLSHINFCSLLKYCDGC
jgi:hypothetical protein